jgi:enamine deaminase RidA (YjgF/YER057c/UK114 family)
MSAPGTRRSPDECHRSSDRTSSLRGSPSRRPRADPYSHVVAVGAPPVFLAGQLSRDANGQVVARATCAPDRPDLREHQDRAGRGGGQPGRRGEDDDLRDGHRRVHATRRRAAAVLRGLLPTSTTVEVRKLAQPTSWWRSRSWLSPTDAARVTRQRSWTRTALLATRRRSSTSMVERACAASSPAEDRGGCRVAMVAGPAASTQRPRSCMSERPRREGPGRGGAKAHEGLGLMAASSARPRAAGVDSRGARGLWMRAAARHELKCLTTLVT